jgi:hypothetical protein
MDPQVAAATGSADWAARAYGDLLGTLVRDGDELGLHTHVWRWDSGAGWRVDYSSDWGLHCLALGLDSYEASFGRPCPAHRGGDRALDGPMLALLAERGVGVDLTVEPGLAPDAMVAPGDTVAGPRPDHRAAPRQPYRSSPAAFPLPDPAAGSDPVLIPLTGVPRGGVWTRALLLSAHPSAFALRLAFELLVRRRRVLAFALRTDPLHLAAWEPLVANIEHLARHRGARLLSASAAARGGTRDGESASRDWLERSGARSRAAVAP